MQKRTEARRKRLKEAAKKAAPKKQSAYDKYFADNKGQKGVTRKPGGASKTTLVLAPKSRAAEKAKASKPNPYSGWSNAKIKAEYIKMSDAEKKKNGMLMHKAAMANKTKGTSKPAAKTTKPPTTKPASNKAVKGGYTISPENRKPGSRGSTRGKDGLPYQGEFPGTPEKKTKPKRFKRTGGSRARTNTNTRRKPSPPKKNDTKVITLGATKMTMVYNGSRWVPKK